MKSKRTNIGFIGAGNMASALIAGLIGDGFNNSHIFASSPEDDHLERLNKEFLVNVTPKNKEVFDSCLTVVLAVKPNVINSVLKESKFSVELETSTRYRTSTATKFSPKFSIDKNNNLLISIVAGCTIDSIEAEVGKKIKIIRAMPNTPASIGMGVSALTNNHLVTLKDKTRAENIFNSVGISCWLKETSFDLYTALIGSGPAYVFYLIEALQLSAEKLGLDKDLSKTLIIEMITGSAVLAKESKLSPSSLRKKVTSPGGVTEKALQILNENKVDKSLIKAILEGENKSKALGGIKSE